MARLGETFGWGSNPIYQGLTNNRNALMQFGAGLASGSDFGDGLGRGAVGLTQGAQADDAAAMIAEERAQQQEALNQTTEWLKNNGKDALYQAVSSGAMTPGDAWKVALSEDSAARQAASAGPDLIEINGQLVNRATGQVMGDYRDPQSTTPSLAGMPSNYQEYVLSQQDPGYADFRTNAPAAAKPPTEAERKAMALTTVTQKDADLLFGDNTPTNPGIFEALGDGWDQAKSFGAFGVNPIAGTASSDFKVAKDAISNITQSYLYAMSGATAPPEEVRKISEQVTPQPFDSPEQKKAKRDRLLAMYSAIQGAQGNAAPASGNGGFEIISVTN